MDDLPEKYRELGRNKVMRSLDCECHYECGAAVQDKPNWPLIDQYLHTSWCEKCSKSFKDEHSNLTENNLKKKTEEGFKIWTEQDGHDEAKHNLDCECECHERKFEEEEENNEPLVWTKIVRTHAKEKIFIDGRF